MQHLSTLLPRTTQFQAWLDAELLSRAAQAELMVVIRRPVAVANGRTQKEMAQTLRCLQEAAHRLFEDPMEEQRKRAEALHREDQFTRNNLLQRDGKRLGILSKMVDAKW
jgi:hypothetical protein